MRRKVIVVILILSHLLCLLSGYFLSLIVILSKLAPVDNIPSNITTEDNIDTCVTEITEVKETFIPTIDETIEVTENATATQPFVNTPTSTQPSTTIRPTITPKATQPPVTTPQTTVPTTTEPVVSPPVTIIPPATQAVATESFGEGYETERDYGSEYEMDRD